MRSEAYRRALGLLEGQFRSLLVVRVLSLVKPLCVVGLLVIVGLLFGLAGTRGEAVLHPPHPDWLPRWLPEQVLNSTAETVRLNDSGLLPIGLANRESDSFVQRAWGRILLGLTGWLSPLQSNLGAVLALLAVALVLLLGYYLISRALAARSAELAAAAAESLRRQVHRQLYRVGQSALPSEGIEPVIDLFSRSVGDLAEGIRADVRSTYSAPAMAGALAVLALLVCWPLALALGALAILTAWASQPFRTRAGRVGDSASRHAQVQMRLLQEDLGMVRTVRVFGMEAVDGQRFDDHLESFRQAEARNLDASSALGASFLVAGAALMIGVGLTMMALLRRPPLLSPAAALVLVLALAGMIRPVLRWRESRNRIRHAGRVATTIFEFLGRKPELYQTSGAQFLPPLEQRILIENVSVTTPSGKDLLEGLNVEIKAGSRVAVMGRDEEAKHAFVCLVPRLLDPRTGKVRIDGHDLKNVTLESLRAQVALVLNSDLIFSDSVAANISLGNPSTTLPKVIEAAKIAHAHTFIQDLPNGYDTIVGPLGHYLRADEQYRIALARVHLHDPSIIIIEEPNGSIDDEIKPLIDDTIRRLSHNRTVLFLPHRLSTIRSCDQVIVLHNGRIEAVGTAKDLQASSKVFRHLQYVEFNQFAAGEIEAGQMGA